MFGFLLFGILFTLLILAGGMAAWRKILGTSGEEGNPRRTRSEARQVQGRFDEDDDFAQNFQRPTQNEVLETLQMLDHLYPDWERGDTALVDHRLKNELAESFPTLRRAGCVYPQPSAEDAARSVDTKRHDHPAQVARARQEFRSGRAQANALDQLTTGVDVGPVAITPGSLPFRASEAVQANRSGRVWTWLALPTVALALAAACWYFAGDYRHRIRFIASTTFNGNASTSDRSQPPELALREDTPPPKSADTPSLSPAEGSGPRNSFSPNPKVSPVVADKTPVPMTVELPLASPPVSPAQVAPKVDTALVEGIAESKVRAVDKYPDLAVPNSEINIRFVFRYKTFVAEKSPRLQDPNWPEKLADECARAASGGSKGKKATQAVSKPH